MGSMGYRCLRMLLVAISVWCSMMVLAPAVIGHPLGNTSVNLYERIVVSNSGINIRFVLDISEIPALREKDFADTNNDGEVGADEAEAYLDGFWVYLQPNLRLFVNDVEPSLEREHSELSFPAGQGGLQLMRAVYDLSASSPATADKTSINGELIETAFEGVPGWHEIVVRQGPGAAIIDSSVPAEDLTSELTSYPQDMLTTPLSVRSATFSYRLDGAPSSPLRTPIETPAATAVSPPPRPEDPLVGLLGENLTPPTALLGLLVALTLGALHAISPGHGKTLVAAYLVGTRAQAMQGVWLGLTVAATHTAGIFILGVATLAFTELIVPSWS